MIPAPDAFRCPAEHPRGKGRCFKAVHGDEEIHSTERRDPLRGSETFTVWQWRDRPKVSEFPEGPFHDTPAIHRREDYTEP